MASRHMPLLLNRHMLSINWDVKIIPYRDYEVTE